MALTAPSHSSTRANFQCPLCKAADRAWPHVVIGGYTIVRCDGCGLLSTVPRPTADELRALYDERYYGGQEAARFRNPIADRIQWFFRWHRARRLKRRLGDVRGRRVLDVGCERGYMLAWLRRQGAEVYGVQVSKPAAAVAARLIGSNRVFVGELEQARYPDGSFDCVTLWHVLEHVPDPVGLLREIRRILKPDGIAYVEVPNAGGWSAHVLGPHWFAYDVPKHLVHFTRQTLMAAAERAGLRCIEERHMSWEYSPVTLLQSLLSRWLGGHHILFRSLSHEPMARGEANALRLALHLAVAVILTGPVLLASWVLAWARQGDTMGAYCVRATSCTP